MHFSEADRAEREASELAVTSESRLHASQSVLGVDSSQHYERVHPPSNPLFAFEKMLSVQIREMLDPSSSSFLSIVVHS